MLDLIPEDMKPEQIDISKLTFKNKEIIHTLDAEPIGTVIQNRRKGIDCGI